MTDFATILFATLLQPLTYLARPGERICWVYLLSALVLAVGVYLWGNRTEKRSLKGFLAYCFPARVYGHPGAWKDVQFFLLNAILLAVFIFPLNGGLIYGVSDAVQALLAPIGGIGMLGHPDWGAAVLATLAGALLFDFALFLQHYAFHRIPFFWEFHKVHHSAEVMTPMTVYRMHPLDVLTGMLLSGTALGLVDGVLSHLYAGPVAVFNAFGLNILIIAFYLLGYNLRHSHIWLDYGPVLDQVFISPAQHQIHHSAESRHWDKNMGFLFAFWDKLFGTLYVPRGQESFAMGLDEKESALSENRRFDTVSGMFLAPFAQVFGWSAPSRHWSSKSRRWAVTGLLLAFLFSSGWYNYARVKAVTVLPEEPPVTSVYLEDLTWTEVRDRVRNGYTTVIIPTGGTEQNGPHMILGKHNYVVRHTAGEIARTLGKTLVAPVVAYVPEGKIEPPDGHMPFAGTLTVPPEVFESVLESTARSLKHHGFKRICLVGDSGGNQESQKRVADKLNREWGGSDARVLHVSDYYADNRQTVWLLNQAISLADIGTHAGIRDTSELLVVNPDGIRHAAQMGEVVEGTGVVGNPAKANAKLGERMLTLKVRAAVRQIREEQASGGPP